jgi:hypothetical protein
MRKELLTDQSKIHDIHPIFARDIAVPFEVMRMPVEPQRPLLIREHLLTSAKCTLFIGIMNKCENDSPIVP